MCKLKKFLGIIIYSSEYPIADLKHYWNKKRSDEPQHSLVQLSMSYARFALIYQCFRFSEDEMIALEFEINDQMKKIWVPSNVAIVDESLCPHKGRSNPHHVFIMRKPHPHGIKNWSLVDFSGYMLKFSMFRRDRSGKNETYEPTDETLLRMASAMPPDSLICADSYFGSVKAMEKLAATGKHSLFSMNQNRSPFLFKDGVCMEIEKDGDSATLYGEVNGKRSGEKVPFLANAFRSQGRTLCTMSTVFLDDPIAKELKILVEDGSEEAQSQFQKLTEIRPEIWNKYSEIMDFVDRADQYISGALSKNRKKHWSTAEKVWELTMLVIVNGKKIYESATGNANIRGPVWKKMVRRTLLGLLTKEKDSHLISKKDPVKKQPKGRCRACFHLLGKESRTVWQCPVCGPICKHCQMKDEKGQSQHLKYFCLPAASRAI